MGILFEDRLGNTSILQSYPGENLASVLERHHIPCTSIITTCDGVPISENVIPDDSSYKIKLIEGYDIKTIIDGVFERPQSSSDYIKNRVTFEIDGSLSTEHIAMNLEEIVEMVENNIEFAITNYNMFSSGDKLLVGLSGGVDSSSLLIALSNISRKLGFTIIAATFQDFDSDVQSPTLINAKKLTKELGVEYCIIPASTVEEAFHLNTSIREILPAMMDTRYGDMAMYADHHTTRRALEVFSEQVGANRIVLGLHTTDLIAGLLNSYTTGYFIADMFKRNIGEYTYVYPLVFVPKKELHLYFYAKTGRYAVHSYPNAWEMDPKDRNYYYYLADQLQVVFPGIENYLFESHSMKIRRENRLNFTACANCGSHILQQTFAPNNDKYCDVCTAFKSMGYIDAPFDGNHKKGD